MNPRLLAMLLSRYMQPNNVTSVPETPLVRAPVDAQTIVPKNVPPVRSFSADAARSLYGQMFPDLNMPPPQFAGPATRPMTAPNWGPPVPPQRFLTIRND